MTTYYVRPIGDGTFHVRHGSRIVAVIVAGTLNATLDVMDTESITWEWEDA